MQRVVLLAVVFALSFVAALALAVMWRRRAMRSEREVAAAHAEAAAALAADSRTLTSAVRRLVAARDEAERRSALLGSAIEHSAEGILVGNRERAVVVESAGATRLLDRRQDGGAAAARIRALAAEVLLSGDPGAARVDVLGSVRRTLEVTAEPLTDELGGGVVVHARDVTQQERVDAMRRDFVANVSHELKTPVGALSVLAEALAGTDDDDTRRRLAARLESEANRVSDLVDDILDLSLVETEPLSHGAVDATEVVSEACRRVAVVADAAGVDVIAEMADEPLVVPGDRRQLVSAVANLLDNAVKHGTIRGASRPTVWVRTSARGGEVVVEVEDQGVGIPDRHRSRIFERFYRVDPGRSSAQGGNGLGLAIVRHVAINHGGVVEMESSRGAGSVFRVRLPRMEG